MKMGRRDFLAASSSALLLSQTVHPKGEGPSDPVANSVWPSAEPGKITVYTTARDSKECMASTGSLEFKQFGQPLESQTCVFVDRSKTFQTFLGVGGAITDASAEVFAKLPKNRQRELLKAYY